MYLKIKIKQVRKEGNEAAQEQRRTDAHRRHYKTGAQIGKTRPTERRTSSPHNYSVVNYI